MTVQANVTGPVTAKIQFDPEKVIPNAFVTLGYSEDGFTWTERPLTVDVFSDRLGGTQGEPIDVQLMGKIATIRGRLIEYDMETITRIQQVATKTVLSDGEVPDPGCLLGRDGEYFRLLLEGAKDTTELAASTAQSALRTPLNFVTCVFREAMDISIGSKVCAIEVVFTAYSFTDAADSNKRKLWNRDTVA